jgi:uncharacterized HAD superfamily protein
MTIQVTDKLDESVEQFRDMPDHELKQYMEKYQALIMAEDAYIRYAQAMIRLLELEQKHRKMRN